MFMDNSSGTEQLVLINNNLRTPSPLSSESGGNGKCACPK